MNVFFLVSNSEILGHPDLYYRLGEMINLTCVISGTAGPPRDIFWYHNQSVIGFYSERKVIILEDKGETSTSQLLLKDADKNDQVIHIIFFYVLSFFLDNFHSQGMVSH